jgi:hypothetical protein
MDNRITALILIREAAAYVECDHAGSACRKLLEAAGELRGSIPMENYRMSCLLQHDALKRDNYDSQAQHDLIQHMAAQLLKWIEREPNLP